MRITSRAAVGWFCWRSRTTWPKTRIIPARLERAFTLAKNQWNFGGVSKITLRRWVFRFGFFGVFRGSCLATFNEKPECEKDSGFLCKCKRHYCHPCLIDKIWVVCSRCWIWRPWYCCYNHKLTRWHPWTIVRPQLKAITHKCVCVCLCLCVHDLILASSFTHVYQRKSNRQLFEDQTQNKLDDRTINKFLFSETSLECLMMFIYRMITGTKWYKRSEIMHTADLIMQ